jgi:hypothetical protein
MCRRVPIFLRRSVVPTRKLVVSSEGRSEPFGVAGPWENWKEPQLLRHPVTSSIGP